MSDAADEAAKECSAKSWADRANRQKLAVAPRGLRLPAVAGPRRGDFRRRRRWRGWQNGLGRMRGIPIIFRRTCFRDLRDRSVRPGNDTPGLIWQTAVAKMIRGAGCGLFVVLLVLSKSAVGQTQNPLKPLDTSSPRATIASFWEQSAKTEQALTAYRREQTLEQYLNCVRVFAAGRDLFDLSETPKAYRLKTAGASFSFLHDILVRLPPVDRSEIPGGPDFDPETVDTWVFPDTEIVIRRIPEGSRQGEYLFSTDTVSRLPEFHQAVIHLPPVRPTDYPRARQEVYRFTGPLFPFGLTDRIPDSFRGNVLGTPLWKVLITLVIAVMIGILTLFWARVASGFASGRGGVMRLAWRMTVPVLLLLLIHHAYESIIELQLNTSGTFASLVSSVVVIGVAFSAIWAAWILIHLLVETVIALPTIPEQSYDAHLLRLVARVVGVLVSVALLLWGANEIGIPAAGMLAGLGVGGFALALAAQSTVENLFGGVSIFADRPFRVGDFIHYGDSDGIVEMIGPRSTRIRGLDGTLTTVPNADLSKMHITNYSLRDKCFFHHVLGVRYETTPDQFEGLLKELRRRIAAHPMVEETNAMPRIRLLRFGSSSIDIDLRAYVLTTNFTEFLSVQEELLLDVIRVVDEAGSGFAFPSVTTYLNNDSGIRADRLLPPAGSLTGTPPTETKRSSTPPGPSPDATATEAEANSQEGPPAEEIQ